MIAKSKAFFIALGTTGDISVRHVGIYYAPRPKCCKTPLSMKLRLSILILLLGFSTQLLAASSQEHHENQPLSIVEKAKKDPEIIASGSFKIPFKLREISTLESEFETRNYDCKSRPKDILKKSDPNLWWNSFSLGGCVEAKRACTAAVNSKVACKPFTLVSEKTIEVDLKLTLNSKYAFQYVIEFVSPYTGEKVELAKDSRRFFDNRAIVSLEKFRFDKKIEVSTSLPDIKADSLSTLDPSEETTTSSSKATSEAKKNALNDQMITYVLLDGGFEVSVDKLGPDEEPRPASVLKLKFGEIVNNQEKSLDIDSDYQASELKKYADFLEIMESISEIHSTVESLLGLGDSSVFLFENLEIIVKSVKDYYSKYNALVDMEKDKGLTDYSLKAFYSSKKKELVSGYILCGEKKWRENIIGIASKRIVDLKNSMIKHADLAKYERSQDHALKSLELHEKFKLWSSLIPEKFLDLPLEYKSSSEIKSLTLANCNEKPLEYFPAQTYGEFFDWYLSVYEARYRVENMKELAGLNVPDKTTPWVD